MTVALALGLFPPLLPDVAMSPILKGSLLVLPADSSQETVNSSSLPDSPAEQILTDCSGCLELRKPLWLAVCGAYFAGASREEYVKDVWC